MVRWIKLESQVPCRPCGQVDNKRHCAGREAHGGAGVEPATEAYKGNRSRRGLSWESEGFFWRAKDNTTPPEGRDPTLFMFPTSGGSGDC